jgi:hypothetical protein
MKHLTKPFICLAVFISFFATAVTAFAARPAEKSSSVIKVGSFNICDPKSRMKQIKSGMFTSNQKCWSKSAGAVAQMINELDCDVIGFQEVGDSTWGIRGDKSICNLVCVYDNCVLMSQWSYLDLVCRLKILILKME